MGQTDRPALLKGLCLAAILGGLALVLGQLFPIIGANVWGIVLGIGLSPWLSKSTYLVTGLTYAGKNLLQYAVILLGFGLSLTQVSLLGLSSLPLTLLTIGIALVVALVLGKWQGLSRKLVLLIGFGTAICGGSAIMAMAPVIKADEDDIALSLTTIFFFNILAIFIFPLVGTWLGLSDEIFGLWAGTAVNDTSSVVTVAYTYSQVAGDYATVVKLARSLMIVPACLLAAGFSSYQSKGAGKSPALGRVFPWFILWFLVASCIASLDFLPAGFLLMTKNLSKWLMATALVGIGSRVSLGKFSQLGLAPLLTGGLAWLAIALSSLIVQYLFF